MKILLRHKFPMVCQKVETMARSIMRSGPERTIDMDDVGMRLALDVVAVVSSFQASRHVVYSSAHSTCSKQAAIM